MPQLTDRFGPIPSNVVLDGSGNGTLTFQPNGSNARITNLYVNVATSVAQAVCTMYKGQVAPSNIIDSTNSGSTGASAKGNIDLTDGEILYVVWTGGDAGARAFATFTGVVIPFDKISASSIDWSDPVAAGDGSLVYPALKSPNFVTGVTGWIIRRDGTFELSGGIFRGEIEVDGPNHSNIKINAIAGFPTINFYPDDVGPPAATNLIAPGEIFVSTMDFANQIYVMDIASPAATSGSQASITLTSTDKAATTQAYVEPIGILRDGVDKFVFPHGQGGRTSVTVTASTQGTAAVTFTPAFPVGVTPIVIANRDSGAGVAATFYAEAINITNAGFTAQVRTSAAAATFTTDVGWIALLPF